MPDNISTLENNDSNRLTFTVNKFYRQLLIMGIISLIVGLTILILNEKEGGVLFGMGVLFIVFSLVSKRNEYIILDADCIGVKWGFRARVNILINEITRVEKTNNKIKVYYKMHGEENAAEKKLVIALNIMDDKAAFLEAFDNRYYK